MQVWFHFGGASINYLFVGGADWAEKGIIVLTEHFLVYGVSSIYRIFNKASLDLYAMAFA